MAASDLPTPLASGSVHVHGHDLFYEKISLARAKSLSGVEVPS